jgi:hypothetical protein
MMPCLLSRKTTDQGPSQRSTSVYARLRRTSDSIMKKLSYEPTPIPAPDTPKDYVSMWYDERK